MSKGQSILSVPASRWITPEVVAKSEIGQHVQHLQAWVQLALFVMAARANPRLSTYPVPNQNFEHDGIRASIVSNFSCAMSL